MHLVYGKMIVMGEPPPFFAVNEVFFFQPVYDVYQGPWLNPCEPDDIFLVNPWPANDRVNDDFFLGR